MSNELLDRKNSDNRAPWGEVLSSSLGLLSILMVIVFSQLAAGALGGDE